MVEEIDFENHHFWNFKFHVTLTLTSDDLESHIVVNVSSTLTNTTIWFVAALCLIVDIRTYVHTAGHFTGFIRSSLRRWPKNAHSKQFITLHSANLPHTVSSGATDQRDVTRCSSSAHVKTWLTHGTCSIQCSRECTHGSAVKTSQHITSLTTAIIFTVPTFLPLPQESSRKD